MPHSFSLKESAVGYLSGFMVLQNLGLIKDFIKCMNLKNRNEQIHCESGETYLTAIERALFG